MAHSYGLEKFREAVDDLAVGKGRIQERLVTAFVLLVPINPQQDLPTELRDQYTALKSKANRIPARHGEGTLEATISQMDDERAQQCAREIVSIYHALMEAAKT